LTSWIGGDEGRSYLQRNVSQFDLHVDPVTEPEGREQLGAIEIERGEQRGALGVGG
jgi:hypothetical protein